MSNTNQPQTKRESLARGVATSGPVASPRKPQTSVLKQNLYQALAILVCTVLGALIGFVSTRERLLGAFLGGSGGFLTGFLASGIVLLICRNTNERSVGKPPAEKDSLPGPSRDPAIRTVARCLGLTMVLLAIVGFSGVSSLGESRFTEVILLGWLFLLAVGLATVYGLKSPRIRLIGAVLNDLLALLGLALLVLNPGEGDPILRRMIGAFCLAAAAVNIVALRPRRAEHTTSSGQESPFKLHAATDLPTPEQSGEREPPMTPDVKS